MTTESKRERTTLQEYDPFQEFRAEMRAMEEDLGFVRNRLRSMFDPWMETHGVPAHGHEFALPSVDLEDRGTAYEARFDLPGIPKEHVSVKVVGQRVEVHGEVEEAKTVSKHAFVLRERAHRGFDRVIELPQPIIGSEVQAKYEAGVLTLTIPKTRQAAEHRIAVG